MKYLLLLCFILFTSADRGQYDWKKSTVGKETIESVIKVPQGFSRVKVENNSFAHWLRNIPLKPQGTPVKLWNGELKGNQNIHLAVVDLDFIGKDLQQCIDVILRLRAEYLWSNGKEDEIEFSYSCCPEKVSWKKWKDGYRTKIIKKNGKSAYEWVKTTSVDGSRKNFEAYLRSIMIYAGTLSLSKDMNVVSIANLKSGDAFIQGAAPGYGHGVIVLDMAIAADGKRIMLLGQSYNPTENFNVLKSDSKYSPWFEVDFVNNLNTPQWAFTKEHARSF